MIVNRVKDITEFLKENLRIDLNFNQLYVSKVNGVSELSASLYLGDELITESKIFTKDGESYPAGEDGEPWSPSNEYGTY